MIPSQRQVNAGHFKLIKGVWHKRCTGPAHEEPVWLPATEKYFYVRKKTNSGRQGLLVSRCRLCNNWKGIPHSTTPGLVPCQDVIALYREAVARVGMMELSRRLGMHYTSIEDALSGRVKMVRKSTVRKLMLELISMRRKNEYSINATARWKNERRLIDSDEACAGCGTHLSNFTAGCNHCSDRKSRLSMSDERREIRKQTDRAAYLRRRSKAA